MNALYATEAKRISLASCFFCEARVQGHVAPDPARQKKDAFNCRAPQAALAAHGS
ncbi:MAG: hypothetical protein KF800_13700 [Lysobacter sp.]|nr:hypothetical protein [Lysobacter sp.]